jgi:hypothetical protein
LIEQLLLNFFVSKRKWGIAVRRGILLRRTVLATVVLLATVPCLADDCSFLNRDPLNLRDRQLFFRPQGVSSWSALDDGRPDLTSQNVEFAYVIRESIDPARAGVVIMKSARLRRPEEPPAGRNVHLVRKAEALDNGTCGAIAGFGDNGEARVSADSYDRYHDEGKKVPERDVLRAFHIRYAARKGTCRATNDSSQDSIVPWDPRSNRSQFSFDPNVVSGGTYSQVLAWTGVTKTYASSTNLSDQRVELKQYRVDAALPTCVRFRLATVGRGSFLRINDLEGLAAGGLNYVRANENQWTLAP